MMEVVKGAWLTGLSSNGFIEHLFYAMLCAGKALGAQTPGAHSPVREQRGMQLAHRVEHRT